jgi:hypothetical protein
VLGFYSLRLKTLLFRRRRVHRRRGHHNRVASRGNDVPVGDKTAKYTLTVGDEFLAKLKRVIHARLPSLWSLRACHHRSLQNNSDDKHDFPLHRHILLAAAQLGPWMSRTISVAHDLNIADRGGWQSRRKSQSNIIIAGCPNVP